jgi:hypothetical protein
MAYLGFFSRFIADDYCTTNIALSEGAVGSVFWWYNNWAGQFTNWTLKGIAGAIGPGFAPVLPFLIISLGLVGATWMLYEVGLIAGLSWNRGTVLLLASVMMYAIFDGLPSMIQSLYWLGASLPYTTPLIFLTFLIGFYTRAIRNGRERRSIVFALIVILLVTFVAGGLSEIYSVFQVAMLGLGIIALLVWAPEGTKRAGLPLLAVALVGSLIALIIIIVAPGNAVRQALFPHQVLLPELAVQTVVVSAGFIVLALGFFAPIPLLVTVIVSALVAYQFGPANVQLNPKHIREWMAISAGVAWLLIMSCLFPPLYGLGTAPSSRAYVMPMFVLVSTAGFWGALMGVGLKRSSQRLALPLRFAGLAGIALLLVVGPLASTWQILEQRHRFSVYAAEWDARDQAIREAVAEGIREFEVTTLTVDLGEMARLDVIGSNPQDWVNQCAAEYYGLESLTARTPLQMAVKETG